MKPRPKSIHFYVILTFVAYKYFKHSKNKLNQKGKYPKPPNQKYENKSNYMSNGNRTTTKRKYSS